MKAVDTGQKSNPLPASAGARGSAMCDASGQPLPLDRCPTCAYLVDAASRMADDAHRPEEGDFSVCLNCGAINRFGPRMRIVTSSLDDATDEETRYQLSRFQNVIRARGPIPGKPGANRPNDQAHLWLPRKDK